MKIPAGTPEYFLRKTSDKYGTAIIFMTVNYLFIGSLFHFAILYIIYAFTGSTEIDTSTDIGYAAALLINAVDIYFAPILFFALFFRSEIRETRNTVPYPKVPCELLLLFFAGGCLSRTGGLITSYISAFLNYLFNIPEPEAAFSDMKSHDTAQFLTFAFFSIIAAPLFEELIYRHLLLRPMRKYGDMQAVVMSGLIFGLSHYNFDQFLYTALFGFTLSIAAIRRNSVKPAIIIHALNNLLAVISNYTPDTFGDPTLDGIFNTAATIAEIIGFLLLFGGAVAVIIAVILHLFEFRQPVYIPNKTQFRIVFTSPIVIIGIVSALVLTFFLLYI